MLFHAGISRPVKQAFSQNVWPRINSVMNSVTVGRPKLRLFAPLLLVEATLKNLEHAMRNTISSRQRNHGPKLLFFSTQEFRDFFVAKVFFSTRNVKHENFMQGEGREEKFLNIRLQRFRFTEATLLKQASKDRSIAHAAGKL